MGTKRKASQINIPTTEQPPIRRSKRNAGVTNGESNKNEVINIGIHEIKSANAIKSSKINEDAKVIKLTREPVKQLKSVKQTARAIINEKIDFNKDVIPIRTYGRSNAAQVTDQKQTVTSPIRTITVQSPIKTKTAVTKSDSIDKIQPASKVIKKKNEQVKKKANLTISSPTRIEVPTDPKSVQNPSLISTIGTGGQKKIIINKIIMPPDAYNQMIKQSSNQTLGNKVVTTSAPLSTTKSPIITNQVPVQLFNNLQTNLGPLVLSSGIKMMPNQQLLVTNPSSVLTTTNVPINLPINQINQLANSNQLRIITSPNQLQTQPGQIKQLQLPIIIKSIVNPLPVQQTATVNTLAKTITSLNSPTKVNPITSVVKPVPISKAAQSSKSPNKSPEKVVVNIETNKRESKQLRKTRVSFNFEKNTSTSIKPISNDLPITASNVLMTSTPKQSIIKKPKVFELPCTPIVNNLISKKVIGTRQQAVAANKAIIENDKKQTASGEQVSDLAQSVKKNNSQQTAISLNSGKDGLKSKYCEANQCDCYSKIPKDDLENAKKEYQNLNAPKKMLYIYCTTIKLDKEANFDFEKYAYYIRTKTNGFVQVCHRVFLEVYEKSNLTFVDTAFRKFHV